MLSDAGGIQNPDRIKENVVYTGLFLDHEQRENLISTVTPHFEKVIAHHITLSFRPEDGIKVSDLGKLVEFKITGQVINEEIGVQAVIVDLPEDVQSTNKSPHITISVRPDVPPVKSNDAISQGLENGTIINFDEPIILRGHQGYFNGDTKKVVTSL